MKKTSVLKAAGLVFGLAAATGCSVLEKIADTNASYRYRSVYPYSNMIISGQFSQEDEKVFQSAFEKTSEKVNLNPYFAHFFKTEPKEVEEGTVKGWVNSRKVVTVVPEEGPIIHELGHLIHLYIHKRAQKDARARTFFNQIKDAYDTDLFPHLWMIAGENKDGDVLDYGIEIIADPKTKLTLKNQLEYFAYGFEQWISGTLPDDDRRKAIFESYFEPKKRR